MNQTSQTVSAARGARILHLALAGGLALVGGVFLVLESAAGGPLSGPRIPGVAFAVVSVAQIVIALGWFRQRVRPRAFSQSVEDYWSSADIRGAAIVVWALLEGAGLFSWVGYLLIGGIVPAATAVLALVLLVGVRPSRLEADGAA